MKQERFTFRAWPDDIKALIDIKNELDMPWPSVIKLLVAEHKELNKEK